MTGYTLDDVGRSLQRYFSAALGDNPEGRWEWRQSREEVADDQRPVAVVDLGTVLVERARHAIDQGNVIEMVPATVTCYPPLAEVRAAASFANQLASFLMACVVTGVDLGYRPGTKRPLAGPMRMPLWNFAGVATSGAGRNLPVLPHDVMWVEDVSAGSIQDPSDARRWTVVCDVRVSWERSGRVPPVAPIAARFLPTGPVVT